MTGDLKESIKNFWNGKPCGTFGIVPPEPDQEYFERIRERRYRLEPFVLKFIDELDVKSKKVLEIGCGVGTDGLEIARRCADYTAIDVSNASLALAKRNFEVNGGRGTFLNVSAEEMPFPDDSFDAIYSWGVLHHTPDMEKAFREVRRVLKPGGKLCIMLYNRFSLVGFQLYVLYGLLRLNPSVSFEQLFAEHHESPGTKALTDMEASVLFRDFKNVLITNVITPYDLRIARNVFLPLWLGKLIPSRFGFFKVIRGNK